MTEISEYLDNVFNTLGSEEKRHILSYLQDEEGGYTDVDGVTEYLEGKTQKESEIIKVGLKHNHLPQLRERGWIDYDMASGDIVLEVEENDRDDLVMDYLSQTADEDDKHLSNVFNTLSQENRRRTLYWLENEEGRKSTLNGIATYLAEEAAKDSNVQYIGEPEPSEEDIEKEKVHLFQADLPKLEDLGWVDYDSNTQKVSLEIDEDEEPDGLLLKYLDQAYEQEG